MPKQPNLYFSQNWVTSLLCAKCKKRYTQFSKVFSSLLFLGSKIVKTGSLVYFLVDDKVASKGALVLRKFEENYFTRELVKDKMTFSELKMSVFDVIVTSQVAQEGR